MKSALYIHDTTRIRAAGVTPSYAFENGKLEWSVRKMALKFLVIGDLLVIGAATDHSELFSLFMTDSIPVDDADLQAKAKKAAHDAWYRKYDGYVVAAGQISADGRITGWKSSCFRVETPLHMRDEIEREIGCLFQSGQLTPRNL